MADLNAKIIPLRTETEGLVPTSAQLDVGEIATNLKDRTLFSKRADGTIVTLGSGDDDNGIDNIQEADDFGLYTAAGFYSVTRSARYNKTNNADDGEVGLANLNDTSYWMHNDANGNDNSVGTILEYLNSLDPAGFPVNVLIDTTVVEITGASDGGNATHLSHAGFTDQSGISEWKLQLQDEPKIPLENGDLLHWVDAESKFKPSKIHILAAADYISPATPADGSALIWSDANAGFIAADPLAGFSSSINDLDDVNTASVSPTNGQALVWSDLNSRWQPGDVVGGGSSELDDLNDVAIATPANAQVLRYDGSGWVNAVLDHSDITNTPLIPSTIAEMTDIDVSLAPVTGQALVWNGTDWAPADQSGGGGGNTLGAWTERADSTATTGSISNNTLADIEFTGLGEAGQFVQVTVSQPAWIVFYATDADRIADATRNAATDPLPGSGVLLEVITESPGDVVLVTPGAIYYNNDGTPDDRLYGKVVNQSGGAADISVTVRAYTQKNEDSPIVPLSDLQAAASTATTFSEFQTLIAAL